MRKEEFDRLPVLLGPRGAREFLGCDRRTLEAIREGNPEIAVKLKGMKQWRYLKNKLASMGGLEVED